MKKHAKLTKLLIILIIVMNNVSCTTNKWPGSEEIAITWEVLSNTYSEQTMVKAEFTLTNHSSVILDSSNWELYFNKSPRVIEQTHPESRATVEHISGDWHRITPQEDFVLKPGEKVRIVYESRHWWIKETDAPKGLYFVFKDERRNEEIVEVENFRIIPFEREEQVSRHHRDELPFPTPSHFYHSHKGMFPVEQERLLPIIPSPASIERQLGEYLTVQSDWTIVFEQGLGFEAQYLKEELEKLIPGQFDLQQGSSSQPRSILLAKEALKTTEENREAYTLEMHTQPHIKITGKQAAGVFYGIQSLLALIDPVQHLQGDKSSVKVPVVNIQDFPRFSYRGVHLDVSRNFHSQESVFKMIDILAFYKINTLHLHLTDDEGWRIEIESLPELTRVGGQRGHTTKDAPALHPSYGSGPHPYAPQTYGSGYYTREEYIEILRYAHKRHITVIPEINLPGHARAAIKAMEARYEYFMSKGDEKAANEFRLIDPEETSEYLSAQLFTDNVVNVARESVYHFFETVADAMIEMYREAGAPLEIFHVGGDEVPRGAWSESPMIKQLMQELEQIDQPHNMHAYFTQRIRKILGERGLQMGGWEEVALIKDGEGNLVPNDHFADGSVIPYVWNNLWGAQDLAYRLANRNFPVVLCHVTAFYFDLAYSNDPQEPGLYWAGFVNTKSAWHYSPYDVFSTTLRDNMGRFIDVNEEYKHMERLLPRARKNILGVQAQLWSETILGPQRLEYYLLPKLVGFAETAWAAPRSWETTQNQTIREQQVQEQWNQFANTMAQRELPRLSYIFGGFNYRIPPPGAILENNTLKANVEFPGLTIRYTTDGSEPNYQSALYENPVTINASQVKLKAFDPAGRHSRTVLVEN